MKAKINKIGFLLLFILNFSLIFLLNCEKNNITQPQQPEEKEKERQYSIIHDQPGKKYITNHFTIHYPVDSLIAFEIANYAEPVYDFVDSTYCDSAPDFKVDVYLTEERTNAYSFGGSKPDGIYLYLNNGANMKQIFAHECGHVVFHSLTSEDAMDYDFINEGISVLIEFHYEMELGAPEPWDKRAYWAAYSNKIKKDELSQWNIKRRDLSNVFYAVGYSFVKFFREQHGGEKWVNFVKGLSTSYDLTAAFQLVSLNYDDFYDQWISFLLNEYNSYQVELSKVPVITDSLIIESHENLRDVKVKITVQNGEFSQYNVWFSYCINNVHQEPSFEANANYFEMIAIIGENLTPGTEILYDVVVLSDILRSWIKSGWRSFILS